MKPFIKKNISVELSPDTLQSTYTEIRYKKLDIEVLKFNDGSLRVTLPEMSLELEQRYCTITAFVENMDDIMIIAQIKDIIERLSKSPKMFTLVLTSTSYTRYDRVMFENKTDSFGAKVFADAVNNLNFDFVQLFDCHSEVMLDLINKSINIDQNTLLQDTLYCFNDFIGDYNIVAPDKGATKKLTDPNMIFDKVRNVETGQITGMEIIHDESDVSKEYLVIDDICEGGRTFIELAKLFKEVKGKETQINLYVTHGIFSNNAVEKLLDFYSKIYVNFMKESDYDKLTDSQQDNVFVNTLINA